MAKRTTKEIFFLLVAHTHVVLSGLWWNTIFRLPYFLELAPGGAKAYLIIIFDCFWSFKETFQWLAWILSVLIPLFPFYKFPSCCHLCFRKVWWENVTSVRGRVFPIWRLQSTFRELRYMYMLLMRSWLNILSSQITIIKNIKIVKNKNIAVSEKLKLRNEHIQSRYGNIAYEAQKQLKEP